MDMTTSAPFDAAIAEMNATMGEMEGILNRPAKSKGGARSEALTAPTDSRGWSAPPVALTVFRK